MSFKINSELSQQEIPGSWCLEDMNNAVTQLYDFNERIITGPIVLAWRICSDSKYQIESCIALFYSRHPDNSRQMLVRWGLAYLMRTTQLDGVSREWYLYQIRDGNQSGLMWYRGIPNSADIQDFINSSWWESEEFNGMKLIGKAVCKNNLSKLLGDGFTLPEGLGGSEAVSICEHAAQKLDCCIDTFSRLIPREVMDLSGSVFYSGRAAFQNSSSIYILGLNPGGSPISQENETIRWHTNNVLAQTRHNWSAYRDESWKGHPPGTHGMQPRVLHLIKRLNLDVGLVPASNIVFVRSKREVELNELDRLARLCWAFHEKVIDSLGVKMVICFGRKAGGWVRKQVGANSLVGEFTENNARRWVSRVFRGSNGVFVAELTHPSIADWTSQAADPSELIMNIFHSVVMDGRRTECQ
jgi:hypothetical protein